MDTYTKSVLLVIAGSLVAIAAKMWIPSYATIGDLQSGSATAVSRILIVRVQGGNISADVSGNIDVSR